MFGAIATGGSAPPDIFDCDAQACRSTAPLDAMAIVIYTHPHSRDAHHAVEQCVQALEAFENAAFARDANRQTPEPVLREVREP